MVFVDPHHPPRCILLVGDYGSGKTEVAVNLALQLKAEDETRQLAIADLDLVNPYFRCREAHAPLEQAGIRVVMPQQGHSFADLPILLPEVKGLLQDERTLSILDVGGDEVGARVLAGLAPFAPQGPGLAFWFVINAHRPFNDTPQGCLKTMAKIEAASGLQVTALVANTHLMDETTPRMVLEGVKLAEEVGRQRGVPLALVAAMATVAPGLTEEKLDYPLMVMHRIMVPPWLRRDLPQRGPALFKLGPGQGGRSS
jgi:hypothetical protein